MADVLYACVLARLQGSQVLFHSFVRPTVFWLLHILFSVNDTLSSYGDSPIWYERCVDVPANPWSVMTYVNAGVTAGV